MYSTRQRLVTSQSATPTTTASKQQQQHKHFVDSRPQNMTAAKAERSTSNKWGWTQMDDVMVPFIFRGSDKFVSVKMVEARLLSKFPKMKQGDLSNVGPIFSYYVTDSEAKLLTEINTRCYNHGFGTKPFSTKDLIVSLENFSSFYDKAKKHFQANDVSASTALQSHALRQVAPACGWLQINNTVIPYVTRGGVKHVPLSVVKYGAGLLLDSRVSGFKVACSDIEVQLLNSACRKARVNFTFSTRTKLIKLEHVIRLCQPNVKVTDLKNVTDPLNHAQYQFDLNQSAESSKSNATSTSPWFGQQVPSGGASPSFAPPPRNPFLRQESRSNGNQTFMPTPVSSVLMPQARQPRMVTPVSLPRGLDPASAAAAAIVAAAADAPARRGSNSSGSAGNSRSASVQSRGTPPEVESPRPKGFFVGQKGFAGKTVLYVSLAAPNSEVLVHCEHFSREFFTHVNLDVVLAAMTRLSGITIQILEREAMVAVNQYCARKQLMPLQRPEAVAYTLLKQCFVRLQDDIFKTYSTTSSSDTSSHDGDAMTSGPDGLDEVVPGRKRASVGQGSGKKAKQVCRRLEDTVQLLRSRQGPTANSDASNSCDDVTASMDTTTEGQEIQSESLATDEQEEEVSSNDAERSAEVGEAAKEKEDSASENELRIDENVELNNDTQQDAEEPQDKSVTSDSNNAGATEMMTSEAAGTDTGTTGEELSAPQHELNAEKSGGEVAGGTCALSDFMEPPREEQTCQETTDSNENVEATNENPKTPELEIFNEPGSANEDDGNLSDATTTDEPIADVSNELASEPRTNIDDEGTTVEASEAQEKTNNNTIDADAAGGGSNVGVSDVTSCHDDTEANSSSSIPIEDEKTEESVEKSKEVDVVEKPQERTSTISEDLEETSSKS